MKTLLLICYIILFASIYANAQNSTTDSITISSKQLEKLNDENAMLQQQLLDLQNELIELGVRKTITFKYNGEWVTYGVVSYWNRYWMDRNLGAKQVATSIYDTLSIGDFYQWGRATDGHQLLTNDKVSYTRAKAGQQPGNDSIIELNTNVGTWDWNANSNWTTRWEDGSHNPKISTNVCPDGWHVPTMPEWATASMNWTNEKSGYESPLKLMLSIGWKPNNQNYSHPPISGNAYWTNTPSDNKKGTAWYLFLGENQKPFFWGIPRTDLCQIRCIKDK
jgi:uncharacterized protein (TIGR02145 family)